MRFADTPSPPARSRGGDGSSRRSRGVAFVPAFASRHRRHIGRQPLSTARRRTASSRPSEQTHKRPAGRSSIATRRARPTTRPATTSVAVLEKRRVIHPVVPGTGSRPRPVRLARPVAGLRRRRSNAFARSVEPESEPVRIVLQYATSFLVASHCITLRVWKPVALRPARPARGDTCMNGGRRMCRGSITQKAGHIASRPHSPDSRGDRPKAASKFVQF